MDEKDDMRLTSVEPTNAPSTVELPDDLRIPLHELQADAGYLVGRVAADGSFSGLALQVLETKLSHVAEAAYRLNGSRHDLLQVLGRIAGQELSADMSVDDQLDADFEGAYNSIIELARAFIAANFSGNGATADIEMSGANTTPTSVFNGE